MRCWECRKKTSSYYKVSYSYWDEELLKYKGKVRNICVECYPELDFDKGLVEVKKPNGKALK